RFAFATQCSCSEEIGEPSALTQISTNPQMPTKPRLKVKVIQTIKQVRKVLATCKGCSHSDPTGQLCRISAFQFRPLRRAADSADNQSSIIDSQSVFTKGILLLRAWF